MFSAKRSSTLQLYGGEIRAGRPTRRMPPHPEILIAMGWCTAALLGALHFRARRRLVLVARASHELRGPLCAARLGLGTLASEPGRIAAIDLELARAGRALDDLAPAPSGARAPEHRRPIDLADLVRGYAAAWTTLAAAHGAQLRLEGDVTPAPAGVHDGIAAMPAAATTATPAPIAGLDALAGAVHEAARRRHLTVVRAGDLPRPWRADGPPAPASAATLLAAGDVPRTWRTDGPPTTFVTADPLRIAQAIANLVSNAAEHGGGVVRIRVCGSAKRVRIEVADDGPGLPRRWGRSCARTPAGAATGWRSPRGSPSTTAAGSPRCRPARAPASCSTCPPPRDPPPARAAAARPRT